MKYCKFIKTHVSLTYASIALVAPITMIIVNEITVNTDKIES